MKGCQKVIDSLNKILKGELTAINQYFLHARVCKDWGYERLAKKMYHESIDEMKHAELLIDRILFLEGIPNLQDLGQLGIGETVTEQLESDVKIEQTARVHLKEAIRVCFDETDHVSREPFEKILKSEEEHIDWLETQLHLIHELGKKLIFLSKFLGTDSLALGLKAPCLDSLRLEVTETPSTASTCTGDSTNFLLCHTESS